MHPARVFDLGDGRLIVETDDPDLELLVLPVGDSVIAWWTDDEGRPLRPASVGEC